MAATFTCSAANAGVQPRANYEGVTYAYFKHAATASISASDVVLLCKIPTMATVLDCMIRCGHNADTQATVSFFLAKVGDSSATAIASFGTQALSKTGGTVLFRPSAAWAPTRISVSDDAAFQYVFLKSGVSAGTVTTSYSLNGYILYTMNEPD